MSVVTLYHGQAEYSKEGKIEKIAFNSYFYLTPNLNYALSYTKPISSTPSNGIYRCTVDDSSLLDCRSIGSEKTYFAIIQNFFRIKNINFTPELKMLFDGYKNEYALWNILRIDSAGRIKKLCLAQGINGIIMLEEGIDKKEYESYLLFNDLPLKSIELYEAGNNLVENILKESKQLGTLYHYTNFVHGLKILDDNRINSSVAFANNMKDEVIYGISTTRDSNFQKIFNRVDNGIKGVSFRISLDGDKLSEKYKIKPFNFFYYAAKYNIDGVKPIPPARSSDTESEELIVTDGGILNIKQYIKEIYLFPEYEDATMLHTENVLRVIKQIEAFGIKVHKRPEWELAPSLTEKILKEAKQRGTLYHYTNLKGIKGILKQNKTKISRIHVRDKLTNTLMTIRGLSTTRDKNFNTTSDRLSNGISGISIKINLNGDKLSDKYKIIPHNYFYDSEDVEDSNFTRPQSTESEEFVIAPNGIDNIKNYIESITIFPKLSPDITKEAIDYINSFGIKTEIVGEINEDVRVIDYTKDMNPLQDMDKIRVYHGFNNANDAFKTLRFGLSGQVRAQRIYSYEYVNNPKGLFVSTNLGVIKREFAHSGIIIEFDTIAKNLEAPVWAGRETFYGQGSYTSGFYKQGEGYDDTLRSEYQKELDNKYKDKDPEDNYGKNRISKSDRPSLANTIFNNPERQALFIGNLNPNEIKYVWFHKELYFNRRTTGDFVRYTRQGFLKMLKGDIDKEKGTDGDYKSRAKIFLPNENFDINKFQKYLDDHQYGSAEDFIKNGEFYNLFYPKQMEQIKKQYADILPEIINEKILKSNTKSLSEKILREANDGYPFYAISKGQQGKVFTLRYYFMKNSYGESYPSSSHELTLTTNLETSKEKAEKYLGNNDFKVLETDVVPKNAKTKIDHSIMPFGKYKGITMSKIPKESLAATINNGYLSFKSYEKEKTEAEKVLSDAGFIYREEPYGDATKYFWRSPEWVQRGIDYEAKKQEELANKKESNWLGEVGEKISTEATFIFSKYFETKFGGSSINKFVSEAGANITYFGNSVPYLEKGDRVKIVATIKKLDTYNNEKNTIITRPKFEILNN